MKRFPLVLLGFAISCCPPLLCAQVPAKPVAEAPLKWDEMNLGPFQAGTFKVKDQITAKGLAIRLGSSKTGGTVLFDTETLRWSAAWTGGGFLKFPRGRGGLEGQIEPVGEVALSTAYAPGWAVGGELGDDPRERHRGHLPAEQAKWHGLYLHGDETILSYTVGKSAVLEVAGLDQIGGQKRFLRTIRIEPTTTPISMLLFDFSGANGTAEGSMVTFSEEGKTDPAQTECLLAGGLNLPLGAKMRVAANGRAVLDLPVLTAPATFTVVLWSGMVAQAPKAADLLAPRGPTPNLVALTKGGPAHWGAPLESKGVLGTGMEAYVGDEIPFPEEKPFGSWFRPGGHDFFADGRAAVCSISGDVWIVSGLDAGLEHVQWKRIATGLFQPLGLKIVQETIYVLGRDQITRLHDLNGDGEADWYECFNNDCVVTENYHEFALDLQTDRAGNFYFAKGVPWQPNVTTEHQGCVLKVSPDGAKLEVIATGLRAPNGMGMSPADQLSVSDNQGHWMPANRLNLVRPGGFYGMVPGAHRKLTFQSPAGDSYQADPSSLKDQAEHKQNFWGGPTTPIPQEGYDLPLCWLPMTIDNSSGGEVWVPEGKQWGPYGGQMLQMSYGKCTLFAVLPETVAGVPQAGVIKFPIKFSSGIMRGRFNPADGQLYLSGLRVWQSDAGKDGCFYRVRYTGQPLTMPVAQKTTPRGVELTFPTELDAAASANVENFDVTQWNYWWSGNYGSPDFSVRDPSKKGRDTLAVTAAKLSPDHKTLTLEMEDFRPAMQMRVKYKLATATGATVEGEVYGTVHRVPTAAP